MPHEDHEMVSAAELGRFETTLDARLKERFDAAQVRLADLRQFIAEGFDSIRRRQDVTNGRLEKNEVATRKIHDEGCALMQTHLAAARIVAPSETKPRKPVSINLALTNRQVVGLVLALVIGGMLIAGRAEAWYLVAKLFGK